MAYIIVDVLLVLDRLYRQSLAHLSSINSTISKSDEASYEFV